MSHTPLAPTGCTRFPEPAPPKPGMIGVSEGEGSEIEVEVWKLSPAAFGLFVAAIPA
ncbi:hypothetical protein [Rhizobium gallicum]|uniref:allophanate hydrolase-related protein n=1 Tax=Rhizobium gallicum TaxID=56730 RepID=UPI001EF8C93D|nr:hypothetical protein [Rhizobium gallicum]ULJ75523.1 hypothetical protein L2W42_35710 [Rhizobium gallicum]